MLSPKNWKYRMALWMTIFFVLLAWVLIGQAQNARDKTFPIGKEFVARIAICNDLEFAQQVADEEDGIEIYFFTGFCHLVQAPTTFHKTLFTSKKGNYVYEVTIGGEKYFAISNWKPFSI